MLVASGFCLVVVAHIVPLALTPLMLAALIGALPYPAGAAEPADTAGQGRGRWHSERDLRLLLWLCLLATAGEALAGSWSVIHCTP